HACRGEGSRARSQQDRAHGVAGDVEIRCVSRSRHHQGLCRYRRVPDHCYAARSAKQGNSCNRTFRQALPGRSIGALVGATRRGRSNVAGDEPIYQVDEITPKPGQAQEFLKTYMERYAPGAVARGFKLEFTWVSPPLWLK